LVIDDHVEFSEQINQTLIDNGFCVTKANTTMQALDALIERYDFILWDYVFG
jgi:DNA-binding response OmpR family regulator